MKSPPNVFSDAGATPASLSIEAAIWSTQAPSYVDDGFLALAENFVEYHEILGEVE